jgi:Protein of unknown function DUF262
LCADGGIVQIRRRKGERALREGAALSNCRLQRNPAMAKKSRPTPTQIEKIYDSGANRLTQERNDFLLPQVIDFVKEKKWLNLRPEYQRRLVWDAKKKSLFIESLLMNIPVPPVFLYETDLNRYEVMDGQQRLNAIVEFYANRLKLSGLEIWSVLNGQTYAECPPRIKSGLDRRRISANVLLAESAASGKDVDFIRRIVFERLNTGGQQLNAQELRNSLYSGPFNDLIIDLAGNRLFDDIWEIPPYEDHYRRNENYIGAALADNKLFKRMTDCEIVLRFFAFRKTPAIRGSVRSMLDKCMAENREASREQLDAMKKAFEDALEVSFAIFGQHTFRIRDPKARWKLSQPLFDGVMVAVDSLVANRATLIENRAKIAKALQNELKNEKAYEIVVGKPNTATAIKERIAIITAILKRFC